jgi:hypothetical protein
VGIESYSHLLRQVQDAVLEPDEGSQERQRQEVGNVMRLDDTSVGIGIAIGMLLQSVLGLADTFVRGVVSHLKGRGTK